MERLVAAVNERDHQKIAGLLNYTYIRVDPGKVESLKNAEAFSGYASRLPFQLPEDWDHSECATVALVQHSKVSLNVAAEIDHVDAGGNSVSRSQAVYLITRKDGKWGIQAGSVIAS